MENKKRLISVEKTVEKLKNEIYWTDSTKAAIRAFLRTVPAVDAVEVVHGRWSFIGENCCVCSVCHKHAIADYYFCPECGAKMDGKE